MARRNQSRDRGHVRAVSLASDDASRFVGQTLSPNGGAVTV
jgi:hypothetical protein